jgi:L-aspartate semialdehyde sulfurtransferase ferredoxin
MVERKFVFTFDPDSVSEPITYRLAVDYGLMINILRAEVNEHGGRLIAIVKGDEHKLEEALLYLEKSKVHVQELNKFVTRDESRCTDCSMCTSICPVRAYTLDRQTWKVEFDQQKCIACGLCADACPRGAIHLGTFLLETQ